MAARTQRILIVDDNLDRRSNAAHALRAAGFDVEEIPHSEVATRMSEANADLVLADLSAANIGKLTSDLLQTRQFQLRDDTSDGRGARGRESLRTLAHDLRTPLNAILGWAQLLKFGELDEAMKQEALDVIERSANTQAELITRMLEEPPV